MPISSRNDCTVMIQTSCPFGAVVGEYDEDVRVANRLPYAPRGSVQPKNGKPATRVRELLARNTPINDVERLQRAAAAAATTARLKPQCPLSESLSASRAEAFGARAGAMRAWETITPRAP